MSKTTWQLDPSHSEVQFKVKHMMIATVTGEFSQFSGQVETDGDDWKTADIEFAVDVNSVSTRNPDRDNHLKSEDFFHAAEHPQMKFKSTGIEHKGGDDYVLKGDLSIREHTHPIELKVEFGGLIKDPWRNSRAAFTVEGKLNRKDYGLKWNQLLETGNAVVADQVKILANVQFVHQ